MRSGRLAAFSLFFFCLLALVLLPQDSALLALLLGGLVAVSALASWRAASATPLETSARGDAVIFCALVLVSGVIRLCRLGHASVWLDEAAQALAVAGPDSGAVLGAIKSHQPPLDYLLTQLGVKLIGVDELGVRLHSALLGSLAPPLFFALLRQLRFSALVSAFGGLCLAFDPTLIYYSREGRPYSLAVFLETIYLSALAAFLDDRPNPAPTAPAFLAVSALMLALSIVFQPPVLMGAFCAAALAATFVSRFRRRAADFLAVHAAAMAAYAPFHLAIAEKSQVYLRPHWADSAVELLRSFDARSLAVYFAPWPRSAVALFAACAIITIAARGRKTSRGLSPETVATTIFAVLIAAIMLHAAAYRTAIRWPFFTPRYFITFLPLFYLAGCALVEAAYRRLRDTAPRAAALTWAALASALLPGVLNSLAVAGGGGTESALGLRLFLSSDYAHFCLSGKPTSDFRSIFAHLANRGAKDDVALPLTFRAPGELVFDGFLTADFYHQRGGLSMKMPVFRLDHSGRFVADDFLRSTLRLRTPPMRIFSSASRSLIRTPCSTRTSMR